MLLVSIWILELKVTIDIFLIEDGAGGLSIRNEVNAERHNRSHNTIV